MVLLEEIGNFLKQLVQRYPGFEITLLSDLIQSLQVIDLKDSLTDQIFKEVLRFLYQLSMTINNVDFLKYVILLYPIFLL